MNFVKSESQRSHLVAGTSFTEFSVIIQQCLLYIDYNYKLSVFGDTLTCPAPCTRGRGCTGIGIVGFNVPLDTGSAH